MTVSGGDGKVTEPPTASWAWRVAARWLDTLLQMSVAIIGTFAMAWVAQEMRVQGYRLAIAAILIFAGAVLVLYEPVLVATRSRTWGMARMGVRVVDRKTGRAPGPGQAAVRFAVASLPGAALVVAAVVDRFAWYLYRIPRPSWELPIAIWWALAALLWWLVVRCSAFVDDERRGWHDKAAGTIVVASASGAGAGEAAVDEAAVGDPSPGPPRPPESLPCVSTPDGTSAAFAGRLRAWSIDAVSAAAVLIAGALGWGMATIADVGWFCTSDGSSGFFPECDPAGWLSVVGVMTAVCAVIAVTLHGVVPVARGRQTLGMRASKTKVVAFSGGGPAGYARASMRWLLPPAAFVVGGALVVGSPWWRAAGDPPPWWWISSIAAWSLVRLSALWGAEGRGWNDKLAGTVVIEA